MFFSRNKDKKEDPSIKIAGLSSSNFILEEKIKGLILENKNLRARISERTIVDLSTGDPAPVDSEQRALYVAKVAGLHKEILEPKLKHMIRSCYALLEQSNNDREYDQAVKGTIYAFWELIRWGDMMVNEQISNQTNQNPSIEDELINKIS